MPAPNLGLVGARGTEALYGELQQMVAERQFAQKLEEARMQAEFDRAQRVRDFEALERYRTTQTGLAERQTTLDENRFTADEAHRAATTPSEIALRKAQLFKMQVGDPYEQATQREHDLALAKTGDQAALARLQAQHGFRKEELGLEHGYRMAEDAASAARKAAGQAPDPAGLETVRSAMQTLKTGPGKSGAVGAKNWTSLLGYLDEPFAGTPERDYANAAETVRAFLTLNASQLGSLYPMSDADRNFLISATTRLNRSLQEGTWDAEVKRLDTVFNRMFKAAGLPETATGAGREVEAGSGGGWRNRPAQTPTPAPATRPPGQPPPVPEPTAGTRRPRPGWRF